MIKSSCRVTSATLILYLSLHPHWNNRLIVCYFLHHFSSCRHKLSGYTRSTLFKLTREFIFLFYFSNAHFENLYLGSLKHCTGITGIHKLRIEALIVTKIEYKKSLWVFWSTATSTSSLTHSMPFFIFSVCHLEVKGNCKRILRANLILLNLFEKCSLQGEIISNLTYTC